jgi:hypothetical protein
MKLARGIAFLALVALMPVSASAGWGDDRRHRKFLDEALGALPLPDPDRPGEIRAYGTGARFQAWLRSFLEAPPSLEALEQQQIRSIRLLVELRDPTSFDVLIDYATFRSGRSSSVQEAARWGLVWLLPLFPPAQGSEALLHLERQRQQALAFHRLKDGSLGDWGRSAVAEFDEPLAVARAIVRGETPRSERTAAIVAEIREHAADRTNYVRLHWEEAFRGAGEAVSGLVFGLPQIILQTSDRPPENPIDAAAIVVRPVTRMAWGVAASLGGFLWDTVTLQIPAGAVFSGAVGPHGRELGHRAVNTGVWLAGGAAAAKSPSARAALSRAAKEVRNPETGAGKLVRLPVRAARAYLRALREQLSPTEFEPGIPGPSKVEPLAPEFLAQMRAKAERGLADGSLPMLHEGNFGKIYDLGDGWVLKVAKEKGPFHSTLEVGNRVLRDEVNCLETLGQNGKPVVVKHYLGPEANGREMAIQRRIDGLNLKQLKERFPDRTKEFERIEGRYTYEAKQFGIHDPRDENIMFDPATNRYVMIDVNSTPILKPLIEAWWFPGGDPIKMRK